MNLGIKLLVAEDDPNLGTILKAYLSQKGYTVFLAVDGQAALDSYQNDDVDACILDIMMPVKDGFTVAKEIRRVDKRIPIIFLTAKNLEADKLKGFEIGADDYVTKPFSMEELLARVNATIRRSFDDGKPDKNLFHIGSIVFDYRLGKDYLLHFSLTANGLASAFAPNYKEMDIEWTDLARQQEKGFTFENRYTSVTYKEKLGGTDYLSETSEKVDEKIDETLDWVAFKNQFFSAALISKDDFRGGSLLTSIPQEKGSGYLKQFNAKLKTAFDPSGAQPSEFEMYIGPNDFRLIKEVEQQSEFGKDLDLEQLVNLGWWLVRWINRWFTIYVFDWLTSWGFGMGIVLILITLLLKVITFPMVKKSYMSSAKMRVLKPKLDEATKEYDKPEDAMKKQQAMMQMYSQYGVSPLGGCLPMLIQFPIWMAMFFFVPNAIQLRRESFLWMDDLSTYDPIIEWGTNIWGIGDHLSLTCILFCVSNVLYSYMTMRQQRDQMVGQQAEQMKMMQWMMYLMPIMFFFMFNDYSSGLNFYYFISLFFSAAIMWTLRKTTNDEKLLAILEARYKENKNNPTKKTSGLAARLAAMQKQAEEMQKQRMNQKK